MLVDEVTAFDFRMQMAHRSLDENGVRQVSDLTTTERENMADKPWYEGRDNSTLDEKTHEPKFDKELVAFFKKTEGIRQNRLDTTVFPTATPAVEAQADRVPHIGATGQGDTRRCTQEFGRHETNVPHMASTSGRAGGSGRRAKQHIVPHLLLHHISLLASKLTTSRRKLGWPANKIIPRGFTRGHRE